VGEKNSNIQNLELRKIWARSKAQLLVTVNKVIRVKICLQIPMNVRSVPPKESLEDGEQM